MSFKVINNLYLIKFDERNLAIVVGNETKHPKKGYGNRVQGYYGTIQGAFKAALDIQIKAGAIGVETKEILQAIESLHKRIDELEYPHVIKFLKGDGDEK